MPADCILIFDVGKTHSKASVVDLSTGIVKKSNQLTNIQTDTSEYQIIDVENIWRWFLEQISELNVSFPIKQITVTTHGAAAVVITDNKTLFPVIDYEAEIYDQVNNQYNEIRPDYSETGSLNLPQGLNLGRQLFYLQKTYPSLWDSAQLILMLPQYFCWKLSGIAATEISFLGCHTDLWDVHNSQYSSLVEQCNWQSLFPTIKKAGDQLGTVLSTIATQTGLRDDTVILNGIHDSNASLVPYLQTNHDNLNVISTGTWAVFHAIKKENQPLTSSRKIMHSIDYKNNPVSSMRFMGGREWKEIQNNSTNNGSLKDIEHVIASQCYAYPALSSAKKLTPHQLSALATLYLALMSRYCLDQLDCSGDIIVEGSFTNNIKYLQLLQLLSPKQKVLYSLDPAGTTFGASRLSSHSIKWPAVQLMVIDKIILLGLKEYYKSWKQKLPEQ